MEKISWTDGVRSEVIQKDKKRNMLKPIKRRAKWIDHNLRRNCFLKRVLEGRVDCRIKVTGIRGRSGKQLLNDLKERTGCC
jgi:hypothetical protein